MNLGKNKTIVVLETLKELETKHGFVTPKAFVEASRADDAPTHNLFEWDDEVAAEAFRLQTARHIIRTVEVEYKGRITQKYWHAVVNVNNVPVQGYFSVEKVASNEDLHRQVVSEALKELHYWEEKYAEVKELTGVINRERVQELEQEQPVATV